MQSIPLQLPVHRMGCGITYIDNVVQKICFMSPDYPATPSGLALFRTRLPPGPHNCLLGMKHWTHQRCTPGSGI